MHAIVSAGREGELTVIQKRVGYLKPGNEFRDWLAEILADRLCNRNCTVQVYRIAPASHVVCRYELVGEGFSVVAKFFGEPTGAISLYDPEKAMRNEYHRLSYAGERIHVPRPLAMRSDYHAVLVTEYIDGTPLHDILKTERRLYSRLTEVARLLKQLHGTTRRYCNREREFAYFHKLLDQNGFSKSHREQFNRLLGEWWYSPRIDPDTGCMIHGDATPANYIYSHGKVYAIDFESAWRHSHPMHDLGVLCAEMKAFFMRARGDGRAAEPYIGHLLWQYSNRDEGEFHRNIGVLPFFMALGYMRISRLPWRKAEHDYLLREAEACLNAVSSQRG
jgi:aminoglycoside phosphotransferase (APT) family kinase protein